MSIFKSSVYGIAVFDVDSLRWTLSLILGNDLAAAKAAEAEFVALGVRNKLVRAVCKEAKSQGEMNAQLDKRLASLNEVAAKLETHVNNANDNNAFLIKVYNSLQAYATHFEIKHTATGKLFAKQRAEIDTIIADCVGGDKFHTALHWNFGESSFIRSTLIRDGVSVQNTVFITNADGSIVTDKQQTLPPQRTVLQVMDDRETLQAKRDKLTELRSEVSALEYSLDF